MTITSVTLSGAIAESKGLEFAEHSPVRFARALAISPSSPLDFAIAPLNMTAKAVTPSEVEGSRGWIGVNPYESHRRMFGELETFRLR